MWHWCHWGNNFRGYKMKYLDFITTASPMIVAVLFGINALGFLIKKDYAWSVVWASYAVANISLAILGRR